jgi:hypothetical protein
MTTFFNINYSVKIKMSIELNIKWNNAIKKLSAIENNNSFFAKWKLIAKIQDNEIADNVNNTLKRLERLKKSYSKDKELTTTYNQIIKFIEQKDWNNDYIINAETLWNYLGDIDSYLEDKYPLETELKKSIDWLLITTKNKLSCLTNVINLSCLKNDSLIQKIEKNTNYTYNELIDIISTTEVWPILALALDTTVIAIENRLSAWKQVEIIWTLIEKKKLWFVLSQLTEQYDLIAKI